MPMKENVPFKRKEIRADLRDDEEVFYCKVTDEIFESYEEFCEQVLLYNSLIWSCSYTGKSGLTFEEALASEEHVRSVMKDFPIELRIPVLYLGSITQRTSLENMAEDVFSFSKDRFFVGESVEVNFMGNSWCECHVMQVIEPTQDEIAANAAESKREQSRLRFESVPSSLFRYEVESLDENTEWGEQVVSAAQVRRRKGTYTRDKNRMYLQQFSEPAPTGVWKVKNDILVKHGVQRVKFENIFIGKPPTFQASTNVRKPAGSAKATKQGTMDRYLTASNNQNKKKPTTPAKRTPQKEAAQKVKEKYRNPGGVTKKYRKKEQLVMSVEMLQKLREQQKEEAMEKRRKQLEEKVQQRAQLKEEKRRLAEFMKKWNQQREDLECEDLKQLPVPAAIQCRVPNEHFGHFLMILEFFHNFAEALATKDSFPYGMTFDLVERALSEKEVAGPFSDMLQFLLSTLFFMQGEEDDEILDSKTVPDLDIDENVDVTTSEAIQQATAAAGWSQQYQGTALSKLPLDSVTVTEVLRLHLLSSGGEVNVKWRYQQRGGYTSRDDPGLQLRMQQPHILRALSVSTVFELPLADKLSIMTCLMDQILTYAALRDVVEESLEKYRVQKIELKVSQLSVLKREKELSTLRVKQRKEQRRLKGEAAPGVPAPPVEETEPVEMTEAELEERIGKLEKELTKGLADVQRKTAEVNAIATGHRVVPLGMDRAHRRFWVFNSLPGLFVENDPNFVGPCLAKPTPSNTAVDCQDTLAYVRRLFEEEKCHGGSDKENDVNADKKRPLASPKKARTESLRSEPEDVKVSPHTLVCSANDSCVVHGSTMHRTKWSFFSKEDEVEGLLAALNSRGVRESELRHNLAEEFKTIVKLLAKCPVQKLDQTRVDESAPEERKTSRSTYAARYVDSNLNFPADTDAAEIFELTLRDLIVDLEEKIQHGGLGSLKVYDRTEWRNAIIARKYDKQCDKLEWGGQAKAESVESSARLNGGRSGRSGSRPATPASGAEVKQEPAEVKQEPVEYKDPGMLGSHEPAQNPVVRHLASAILQLGQSLEKKYRQKPLVAEEDDWSQVERWEMSLMASTGLSQLFVHYYTLESSIQWSRSALNANCRLCRRRGDAENMLLCDSCNKGHHLYCLKPKLTKVPQGDWFCPKCRPEVKTPRAARKRRTIFVPDEEEADEDNELIEPAEGEPMFVEVCDTCGEGGHVICCDTAACGLVFHIECLVPPLKKVPRGKWYCPKCKAPGDERPQRAVKDCEWQPKHQSPPASRSRRGCAAAAVAKISKFTKRIQSRASWEDDEEGNGEEASSTSALSDETQPSRRSARKSLEPDPDLPLNNAVLQDLLTDVMKHKEAWPFLRPVPKAQVPDYHIIIKRPMDLGTMKNKLNMLNYTNNSEFIADANLVFENCKMYNHYDALEYKAGVRLRKYFEKRCNEMGIHLSLEDLENAEHPDERTGNGVSEENDTNGEEEEEENAEQEDEDEEEEEDDDERGEEVDDNDEEKEEEDEEEEADTVEESDGGDSDSSDDEPVKKIPRISDD